MYIASSHLGTNSHGRSSGMERVYFASGHSTNSDGQSRCQSRHGACPHCQRAKGHRGAAEVRADQHAFDGEETMKALPENVAGLETSVGR